MSAKSKTLQKLIAFAFEQTAKGNHVFLNYAGHTDMVSVKCCMGKWFQGIDYPIDRYIFLDYHSDKVFEEWANDIISKIQSPTLLKQE